MSSVRVLVGTRKGAFICESDESRKNWDIQGSLGGPIVRDKLWFFANFRDFGSHDDILGMWGNLNAGKANSWTYQADPNLKARNAVAATVTAARLTAQVTPRNKVGFFFDNQLRYVLSASIEPPAMTEIVTSQRFGSARNCSCARCSATPASGDCPVTGATPRCRVRAAPPRLPGT